MKKKSALQTTTTHQNTTLYLIDEVAMDKIDLFSSHQGLRHPKAHLLAKIENPLCNEGYLTFPSSIKTQEKFLKLVMGLRL